MFAFVHQILTTVYFCSLIALPIQIIFANDTVNPEILDRNGKTPYATYNSCGGFIKTKCDELIILEYKPDEEYDNNEFCVWVIRSEECLGSLLTKRKSGFEVGYDFIQVSGFENVNIGSGPSYKISMGSTTSLEQFSLRGHVNYLIFSTDESNTGTGFRIEIVGFAPQSRHRWSDDFISTSPSGTTSLIPYLQYMLQSFVITPKYLSAPSILMDIEYYTLENDHLAVFTMERNGQSINFRTQSTRLNGNGTASFEAVHYTNFVILFYSFMSNITPTAGVRISWVPAENVTTENYISSF